MREGLKRKTALMLATGLVFLAGAVLGQKSVTTQKTVVHAVAWTAADDATPEGLEDFRQATEELVRNMPGLIRAWVGPLRVPLVVGDLTRTQGLVLEFEDVQSKVAYSSHSARKPWADIWAKVRVPRSTNFDVIGQ